LPEPSSIGRSCSLPTNRQGTSIPIRPRILWKSLRKSTTWERRSSW
jgi:3a0501s02: Type II (General) Secretory Pathway (IISP) Family protein